MEEPVSGPLPTTLEEMLDHPILHEGRECVNEGNVDAALPKFMALLEALANAEQGDLSMSMPAAPVYYHFGNALLNRVEDSAGVFGAAVEEANAEQAEAEAAEAEEPGEQEPRPGETQAEAEEATSADIVPGGTPAADGGTADGSATGAEASSEMEIDNDAEADVPDERIAWEHLEVSRAILDRQSPQAQTLPARQLRAKVHLRLGDLQRLNGKNEEAVQDYEMCLKLRDAFMAPEDRGVADVHYQLAEACQFGAGELEEAIKQDKADISHAPRVDELRAKSLRHYKACAFVFEARLRMLKSSAVTETIPDPLLMAAATPHDGTHEEGGGSASGVSPTSVSTSLATHNEILSEVQDLQSILNELGETIDCFQKDLATRPSVADSLANSAGITTIGFGPAAPAAEPSSSSNSSHGPGSTVSATNLVVKKKPKRPLIQPSVPPSGTSMTEGDTSEACELLHSKRLKVTAGQDS